MSSFHNTIATLARCKKPLSNFVEFTELKKQVAGLQKSDNSHVSTARETKDSVDYLTNQVHALSEVGLALLLTLLCRQTPVDGSRTVRVTNLTPRAAGE
jgi:hypothetical protein